MEVISRIEASQKADLVYVETTSGFHIGLDNSYIRDVGHFKITLPTGEEIDTSKLDESKMVCTPEERFDQLVWGYKMDTDPMKYPDTVFVHNRDGKYLFERPQNSTYCWVADKSVWRVFRKEYGYDETQTREFIRTMVKKHFGWRVSAAFSTGQVKQDAVEEYFGWVK